MLRIPRKIKYEKSEKLAVILLYYVMGWNEIIWMRPIMNAKDKPNGGVPWCL